MPSKIEKRFLAAVQEDGRVARLRFVVTPQKPLHRFRVDFAFEHDDGRRLIVELDGPQHQFNREIDRYRDQTFASFGFDTLRLLNEEISDSLPRSLDVLVDQLERLNTRTAIELERFDDTYRQYLAEHNCVNASKCTISDPFGVLEWHHLVKIAEATSVPKHIGFREFLVLEIRCRVMKQIFEQLKKVPAVVSKDIIEIQYVELFERELEVVKQRIADV